MIYMLDEIARFLIYPFLFLSLYFQVFMLFNFLDNKKKMKSEEDFVFDYFPSVTFLLPGWNESKTAGITLESIQNLDYPKDKIKIVYIDNNSTDNTKEIVDSYIKDDSRIIYILETKQGKHHAMNTGLTYVDTDLVACLDVDSTLHVNAMKIAAQYFKDENIKALASCMQLRDIETIWQRAQAIEYMLSVFWRKAYSSIDAIQVMPGPFSVFRKSVFDELGNYRSAHNAEDFEMTLRLHKNGYKIANAHKAYVYTVGPATFKSLIKQRVRWIRGFLENAVDYKDMFFNKKYGHFGMFTLPVAVIFVFYVLYAFIYTLLSVIRLWYAKADLYFSLGLHVPKISFDTFYFNTDVFLFLSMFTLTMLAFVLIVSRSITEDKNPIIKNFVIYFFLYSFVAPIFVFTSVYKFLRKGENKWSLQDTKA